MEGRSLRLVAAVTDLLSEVALIFSGGGVFNHNNGTVTMSTRWRGTPGAAIRIDAGPGTGRNFYNL